MKHVLLCCTALLASLLAAAQWAPVGMPGFSAGTANYTSLVLSSSGTPYVAYQDYANGYKATVMMYNGSSWVPVGSPGFSAGEAYYTSLALSSNGTPYVAYADESNGLKATVMMYNSSSWVPVGSPGFSAGQVYSPSFALSSSGTPYVAYQDGGNDDKATVMMYNGSSWVPVGSPGFSPGGAYYLSIAFTSNGTPYVAYADESNGLKATVMMYNGSSWVAVGSSGFSAGAAFYTSLALSNSSTPYVAYQDDANGDKATVMMYNGSSWVAVGSPGFSAGEAVYTSLAFSSSGTPYVAYVDDGNGYKATVMMYNSSSWVPVGSPGFSPGGAYYLSIAFTSNGTPYVAYVDGGNGFKATVEAYYQLLTGMLTTTYCPGDQLSIPYTAQGYYNSDNIFTAQLSDSTGSFANPVNIGSYASTSSNIIRNAFIPVNTPPGTHYRIRVVSGDPAITGSDNGQDLTVNALISYYPDKDADGYGDASAQPMQQCTQPGGYVTNNLDCDDNNAAINPNTVWYHDADADGYGNAADTVHSCTQPGGYVADSTDCDDNNSSINPATMWVLDADGDGYYTGDPVTQCTSPGAGYVIKTTQQSGDCADNDNTVYPGAPELCDGKDNNCNGAVDENCPLLLMRINDVAVQEGNSGYTKMKFRVRLSDTAYRTITVDYRTVDNTAKAPSDYTATSGTLTFAPGTQYQFINVQIKGDKRKEPDETFKVKLSNPAYAILKDSVGVGTILNDDDRRFVSSSTSNTYADKEQGIATNTNHALIVAPNPANSIVSIQLSGFSGKTAICLFSLQGRLLKIVQTQGSISTQQLNVSDIAGGTYFLRVTDEQGYSQTVKVVVIH